MTPATILAALDLLDKLMPEIQAAIARGEITPEMQQAIKTKVDAVRAYDFSGSEWQPSGRTDEPPV